MPTLYIVSVSLIIYCFDVRKTHEETPLNLSQLRKNPFRIFDYIAMISMPIYIFHSNIFYKLKEVITLEYVFYIKQKFQNIGIILTIPDPFLQHILLLVYGFAITIIFGIVVYNLTKNMRFRLLDKVPEMVKNRINKKEI